MTKQVFEHVLAERVHYLTSVLSFLIFGVENQNPELDDLIRTFQSKLEIDQKFTQIMIENLLIETHVSHIAPMFQKDH